ncbi:hypothetical protein Tco_0256782 [Tanacetum coccineum]
MCERQDNWKCVLTRLIDDLLALDSKVRFDISDLWKAEVLTAKPFSIPTYTMSVDRDCMFKSRTNEDRFFQSSIVEKNYRTINSIVLANTQQDNVDRTLKEILVIHSGVKDQENWILLEQTAQPVQYQLNLGSEKV